MGRRRKESPSETRPFRVGIYLDKETHRGLLLAALHENTSATELVERLIKRYLRGHRKT